MTNELLVFVETWVSKFLYAFKACTFSNSHMLEEKLELIKMVPSFTLSLNPWLDFGELLTVFEVLRTSQSLRFLWLIVVPQVGS